MKPLNPRLFEQLEAVFGRVGVTNEGMPAVVGHRPDYTYRKGRLKAEVAEWGETYRVSCPFCCDARGRLYLSHLWGVNDTRTRDDMLHLSKCHNENCLGTRDKQKELHAMVFPLGKWADRVQVTVKPVKSRPVYSPTSVALPDSIPLDQLHPDHPAQRYLMRRGFDPDQLVARYEVCYCEKDDHSQPKIVEPRLVIPLYALPMIVTVVGFPVAPRLVGWQARLLRGNLAKDDIKYLTSKGTKKNQLLYGLTDAIKAIGPAVIVEGVTDVWKVGLGSLALLGKTISAEQCSLINRHLHGRPVVVLLDDDAGECAEAVKTKIVQSRRVSGDNAPVFVAQLPGKRHDPGECSPEELQKLLGAAIKRAC